MYTIKADSGLLYDPLQNDYALESAKLTVEANKSAVLEITVPVLNPAYSRLKRLTDFNMRIRTKRKSFGAEFCTKRAIFYLKRTIL